VIDPGGQTVTAHDHLPTDVNVATLIVWGTRDPMIPVAHAIAAHQAIPGSRLELFEGSGHFPHLDQPQRFTRLLTEFISA
jgi:pimeloyl-ACP methyl ester carboxylesterase